MRGHHELISLRKSGQRPRIVSIDLGPNVWTMWMDWHIETPHQAYVHISPDELLSGLDVRFCVGMNVSVSGPDRRRLGVVMQACCDAGARRVFAAHVTVAMIGSDRIATVHDLLDTWERPA